jgi:hypothetical protein
VNWSLEKRHGLGRISSCRNILLVYQIFLTLELGFPCRSAVRNSDVVFKNISLPPFERYERRQCTQQLEGLDNINNDLTSVTTANRLSAQPERSTLRPEGLSSLPLNDRPNQPSSAFVLSHQQSWAQLSAEPSENMQMSVKKKLYNIRI